MWIQSGTRLPNESNRSASSLIAKGSVSTAVHPGLIAMLARG